MFVTSTISSNMGLSSLTHYKPNYVVIPVYIASCCFRRSPDIAALSGLAPLSVGHSMPCVWWIQIASGLLLWLGSTANRWFSYLPGRKGICTQRLPCGAGPYGKALSVFAFHIPPFWVGPFGPTLYSSSVLMFIVVDIGFGAVCTPGGIVAPIGIWIIGNWERIDRSKSCFPA